MILAMLIALGIVMVLNIILMLISPFIPPLADFFEELYGINEKADK